MTLRDVGTWFVDKGVSIQDGLYVAATQSFWDWPLWLSITVSIGTPMLVLCWTGALLREAHSGQPEPLGWTVGYGVGTFLCAVVTYDLWVSMMVWDERDKSLSWLRVGYPLMTAFFGSYFVTCLAKHKRHRREQLSREADSD